MRTVSGPTDHVVVVGAGLAGLSAAMRLSGAGRRVTVLERESSPGGRAGRLDIDVADGTFRFDTGPTVLTMPDLIADVRPSTSFASMATVNGSSEEPSLATRAFRVGPIWSGARDCSNACTLSGGAFSHAKATISSMSCGCASHDGWK